VSAKSGQDSDPSCGDEMMIFVETNDNLIHKITFDREGRAIPEASASLMTEILKGKLTKKLFKLSMTYVPD
jgi:nitrogen fixation NifU-like protein